MSRRLASLVLLLLVAVAARAAPPTLTIPADVKPAGDYALVTPTGDAVSVTYVGLSGVEPVPAAVLRDGKTFLLPVRGLANGVYRFAAIGAGSTGEQIRVDFTVTVGGAAQPIPPVVPPVNPPPAVGESIYFVVIRAPGPATDQFTRVMSLPEWNTLRTGGNTVRDYPLAEACRLGVCLPDGTALPVVVTLRVSADGKTSRVVRPAVPLPDSGAGVLALLKGVP